MIALQEVVNKWTRALICQMAHITAIFFSVFPVMPVVDSQLLMSLFLTASVTYPCHEGIICL